MLARVRFEALLCNKRMQRTPGASFAGALIRQSLIQIGSA